MSWYFVLKCVISGVLVGIISEIARRNTSIAAIIASLPLTSILAFVWMYQENRDTQKLIDLSNEIAVIVLPSILFFIAFSFLLKREINFYLSLVGSAVVLSGGYLAYLKLLK